MVAVQEGKEQKRGRKEEQGYKGDWGENKHLERILSCLEMTKAYAPYKKLTKLTDVFKQIDSLGFKVRIIQTENWKLKSHTAHSTPSYSQYAHCPCEEASRED